MLREVIIKALESEFGDGVRINCESKEFAVFEAKHPRVGNVIIGDDGDEIIVSIGDITHGHFGSYESGLSSEEHEEVIAESVVSFLVDLFTDKYFLHKSKWSGGWTRFDMIAETDMQSPKVQWFRWSGPIHRTG